MENNLPEQIYLQVYGENGQLLNASKDEVTWCVDQINESDAVYVLATPELMALLERLASCAENLRGIGRWTAGDEQVDTDVEAARTLAARIREALILEASNES